MHQQPCTNKDTIRKVSRSVPTEDVESSVRETSFLEDSFDAAVESTERAPANRSTPETTTGGGHSTAVSRTNNSHPDSAGSGTVTEVRVADAGKIVPDGRTVERQEPLGGDEATGGVLSALLPVTSPTEVDNVDVAASPPAAKDDVEPVSSGSPVPEGQVAGQQLCETGAQSTYVTHPGTPLVPSPDTIGDWSAALHALYMPISSDESYEKTSVGGLCFLLIVLPAVAITVIYILAYVKGRSPPAIAKFEVSPLTELAEVCPGSYAAWPISGCHEVMSSVLEASNPHVKPCSDFYEHVCGWWSRWKDNRSSQAEEHVRTFNYRVMSSLLGVARDVEAAHKDPLAPSDQMALFYSSCFSMAVTYGNAGGNAGDVLTALGTSVDTWLGSRTLGSFLELVVSASLRTGLPSVIAVWFKDDTYNVDVGKTLASTLGEYRPVDTNYVDALVRDLNGTRGSVSTNWSAAILELDSKLEEIRRGAGKKAWFVFGSPDQIRALAAYGVNWTHAVERGLPEWLRNKTTTVGGHAQFQVREARVIVRLVDRLRPEPLELVGLYALVVLLSQIMKYKVSMQRTVAAFSSPDRMLWCLEQTATYFSAIYANWVAAKFQDKEDAQTLKEMFDHVVATLSRDNRVNAGVVVRTHRLQRARLVLLGGTAGDRTMPTANVPVSVGNGFLPNVAQLITSRVGRVDDAALQTSLLQLKGHFGFRAGDFVVATAFVHRTTLYSPFGREDTRHATLAVRMLRALFESESDYDPAWSAHYVNHCFAASVASTVGRSPVAASAEQDGASSVKPFMGSRWAVQLAWRMHRSSSSPLRGAAKNSSGSKFARLFFRLACFSRCGEPRARDECNDFANFAPELAAAYGCSGKRRGVCDECAAAGRCETHVPQIGSGSVSRE
ncbi:uncharacterized protein [Dermacentor albipictus]|uniref:uncharacterized protein isoform X2 n=1 Tax=Dermacentor albipictus TaxID=60249 RepID=UPI0031FD1EE1